MDGETILLYCMVGLAGFGVGTAYINDDVMLMILSCSLGIMASVISTTKTIEGKIP